MSFLFDRASSHFESNPSKIFFQSLSNSLNGEDCLNQINKISNFLKKKKVTSLALKSKNNLTWPLVYLAADLVCNKIYIFNDSISSTKEKEIINENFINCLYKNNSKNDEINFNCFEINHFSKKKFETSQKDFERKDILFTSGTTGNSKGVVINEKTFSHVSKQLIKKLNQKRSDLELLSMPFNHSFGLARLRSAFICGSSSLITDGLKDFPEIYNFSLKKKLTGLSLVPSAITIIKLMLKNKANIFAEHVNYFEIGSSFLDDELDAWLKSFFKNANIFHHYGMTEASRSFLRPRGINDKNGYPNNWIGEPIDGCSFKIDFFDDSKTTGELLIKGKNVFSGYLGSKNNFLDQGWYRTKDICFYKEKKVFLIGRLDNQINVGGEKVQAEQIEKLLFDIKEIEDITCFPVKDKIFGNKVACLIKLKKLSYENKLELIVEKLFSKYPSYMKPKLFFTLKNLPTTNNGKKIREEKALLKLKK